MKSCNWYVDLRATPCAEPAGSVLVWFAGRRPLCTKHRTELAAACERFGASPRFEMHDSADQVTP